MNPRDFWEELDKELVLWVLAVATIGAINLYSASQSTRPGAHLLQVGYVGVGLIVAFALSMVKTNWFERLAYPIYFSVCGLLFMVLVAGITVKGAQRWLSFGFFNLQPSELMKLAIVFAMARYMSRMSGDEALSLRDLVRPLNPSRSAAAIGLIVFRFSDLAIPGAPTWTLVLRSVVIVGVLIWFALSIWTAVNQSWPAMGLKNPTRMR